MSTFHPLKITNIIKETADAVSIIFDVPTNLKDTFSFIAGQYITIKATVDSEEVRRAYSLCSSPKSNELKVAVKAVENGTFSVYATTKLKVGDVLEVAKPEGRFTLQPEVAKNYIGFAAGSGITPLMAMIKAVLEEDTTATFTLVYGNKSIGTTIFKDELNNLAIANAERFKLHYVFSKEAKEDSLFGRVDADKVNHFIKKVYKDTRFESAFLCGPEAMINNVTEALKANGFADEAILHELFTASTTEEATAPASDGTTAVTVLLDDEEATFTMKQSDDILAASLRNNIDAPYSCQGGICSSCMAIVTEGKAVMSKNHILSEQELADGYILTCQAHPVTPTITVDFDEA